jgi:alpha-D-xyloside xylohydrolase
MNSATVTWWKEALTQFQSAVGFDGLWLDMNEIENFCEGVCYADQRAAAGAGQKARLAYVPTGRDLEGNTIDLDAVHVLDDGSTVTELDAHSTFPLLESKASHEWFAEQGKRTMIISRSALAGQGKYASRWLGDNHST